MAKADIISRVQALIEKRYLLKPQTPVLAMISGGLDSVSLAYILHELHSRGAIGPLVLLHVNHKIRGVDANADAAFVDGFARHLDVPLFNCEVDVPFLVKTYGGNLEAVARRERYGAAYDALKSCSEHFSCQAKDIAVCTAHTANDRIENFYMRSIVGTGPGGLQGISHTSDIYGLHVVRPLLEEPRAALQAYVANRENAFVGSSKERWRHDVTNDDTNYFRAYIRKNIIPQAKEKNSQLEATLTRTMNAIAEEDAMLKSMVEDLIGAYVQPLGEDTYDGFLCRSDIKDQPQPLQKRIFYTLLKQMLGHEARIEQASIDACIEVMGVSGAVKNIQGNIALSYNKQGLRIEPMHALRARRKKE